MANRYAATPVWVKAIATGEVDGVPVAVTGGVDGTVRMWDLRTGGSSGEPLRGHTGAVNAVAVEEVDGNPVTVTATPMARSRCQIFTLRYIRRYA